MKKKYNLSNKGYLHSVYAVISKSWFKPTKEQVNNALSFFIQARRLEPFSPGSIIERFCDPGMSTEIIDGNFLISFGRKFLKKFPDFKNYIQIQKDGIILQGSLKMNIAHGKIRNRYIRVVHIIKS